MLKVLPIQSKAEQEALCLRCHVKFDPDLLAYAATVDDDPVGICQFKLTDRGGVLYDLAKIDGHVEKTPGADFEAMFVMGRGTLNFIDLCGAHLCEAARDAGDPKLLHAIGFRERDKKLFVNMTGMFDGHCDGHAVELKK